MQARDRLRCVSSASGLASRVATCTCPLNPSALERRLRASSRAVSRYQCLVPLHGSGVGVGVAVGVAVGVGVGVGLGTAVGRGLDVGSGEGACAAVGSGVGSGSAVAVGVGIGASVGAGVGVSSGVGVGSVTVGGTNTSRAVGSGVGVGADVAVGAGVSVGSSVGVAVGSGVGVGNGAATVAGARAVAGAPSSCPSPVQPAVSATARAVSNSAALIVSRSSRSLAAMVAPATLPCGGTGRTTKKRHHASSFLWSPLRFSPRGVLLPSRRRSRRLQLLHPGERCLYVARRSGVGC